MRLSKRTEYLAYRMIYLSDSCMYAFTYAKMMIAEYELNTENLSEFVDKQFKLQKNHSAVLGLSKINNVGISLSGMNSDIVRCKKCDKKFYASLDLRSLFYVEECWHVFCKSCMVKYFDE